MRNVLISNEFSLMRLCRSASAERLCLSVRSYCDYQRGYALLSARRSLAGVLFEGRTERRSLSTLCCGTAAKPQAHSRKRSVQFISVLFFLLFIAHCSLLTAFAQP